MSLDDRRFAALAARASRQHAHFTLEQAGALHVPDSTLYDWAAAGHLDKVAPHVFRIAGAPQTWVGDAMRGALWSDGFVSHTSGLALRGMDGSRRTRPIHVELPKGARTHHELKGVRVHETRDLSGIDMDEWNGVPTTTVIRTLLDACALGHPFAVGLAMDDFCRNHDGGIDRLFRRYLELKKQGRTGMALAGTLIAERMGGKGFSHKGFEAHTKRLVRELGLPEPTKNLRVEDGQFVAFIDLAWAPIRWGIECQSMEQHLNKRAHEYDKARRRKLKLLGWELEEVTYDQVTVDKVATGRDLLELYHLRCQEIARSGGTGSGIPD